MCNKFYCKAPLNEFMFEKDALNMRYLIIKDD